MSVGARDGQALPRMPRRAGWKGAAGSPSQCTWVPPCPSVSRRLSGAGAAAALPRRRAGVQSLGCKRPRLLLGSPQPPESGRSRPCSSLAAALGPATTTQQQPAAEAATPNCPARRGRGFEKLLRCPPAGSPPASPAAGLHAHTPIDAAIVTCLRGGCHQSHQSQSGFRAAGRRSTELLSEVLDNRGKVFLELGKVGVLMGRKLLRATICTEGTDLPRGNQPCGQHGQPARHRGCTLYVQLLVQQGEQELFNTPQKY